jgi:hypothetical protein
MTRKHTSYHHHIYWGIPGIDLYNKLVVLITPTNLLKLFSHMNEILE